jgi:hypothetical protein
MLQTIPLVQVRWLDQSKFPSLLQGVGIGFAGVREVHHAVLLRILMSMLGNS